jgi:hypothetical protein
MSQLIDKSRPVKPANSEPGSDSVSAVITTDEVVSLGQAVRLTRNARGNNTESNRGRS